MVNLQQTRIELTIPSMCVTSGLEARLEIALAEWVRYGSVRSGPSSTDKILDTIPIKIKLKLRGPKSYKFRVSMLVPDLIHNPHM